MDMTVNPLSAGNNYVSQVQPQPQTQVDRVAEQENEKKREEAKKAAATSVPIEPTINTNGQKVGSVINVKA
jgi:ssDNA-binding replication factor A large subunit